jgi:thiol-disulfide isomerase/thioredoxin
MTDLVPRLLAVALLLAIATAAWWFAERRRGSLRRTPSGSGGAVSLETLRAATGRDLAEGGRPVVVQLSSEVCTPCRVSARTWRDVGGDEVAFVELDAAENLELVRTLGVMRTPTSLVFDADGAAVGRVGGAPTRAQAAEIVRALVPAGGPS